VSLACQIGQKFEICTRTTSAAIARAATPGTNPERAEVQPFLPSIHPGRRRPPDRTRSSTVSAVKAAVEPSRGSMERAWAVLDMEVMFPESSSVEVVTAPAAPENQQATFVGPETTVVRASVGTRHVDTFTPAQQQSHHGRSCQEKRFLCFLHIATPLVLPFRCYFWPMRKSAAWSNCFFCSGGSSS
jgi:hypothetical protein